VVQEPVRPETVKQEPQELVVHQVEQQWPELAQGQLQLVSG
jgi:hypothetical protein